MSVNSATGNGRSYPELPAAGSRRWQPIRSGLLNVYRYDYEEFRYEQGHLLLRGDNGTGKSRVLALQLPFLLDGETAPHRLEPDGDPAKRIEWNLLLGKYPDRLGYTWLELGRRDDDGACHYLTLGAGLRAVEGRGLIGKWFFITDHRIGTSLFLQSAAGPALTRERLAEAIGDRGEIFLAAAAYRRAVDQALFKLGEHRYEALVDLLIQLRHPQLSRQLDERRLSAALSEALPPVAPGIVADVAEAFRSLEADRTALDAFRAASEGVEQFLQGYRRYTRVAARRRASDVRRTHAGYEATMRRLRTAEAERDGAERAVAELAMRIEGLMLDERATAMTVETLLASPQMRDAEALDRVRRDAAERAREVTGTEAALGRSRETLSRLASVREEATRAAADARGELAGAAALADERAANAGLETAHREAVAPLGLPDGTPDQARLDTARRRVEHSLTERMRGVEHLRQLVAAAHTATNELSIAKQAYTGLTAQLDEALVAERQAHETLALQQGELARNYRTWSRSLIELVPQDADSVADELAEWSRSADGPSPAAIAVRRALDDATRRLAASRAEVEQRRLATSDHLDGLRAEHTRLVEGHHVPPVPPPTRDESARVGRAGAPLWLVCDFRPAVDAAARAGLEAALEASGLLDAWVTLDGTLLPAGVHDTAVVPGTSPQPETGADLGTWLAPTIDGDDPRTAGMGEALVSAVLRHVGARAGAGHVWVDVDGRWQVGPLHGAWSKPAAAHIGQSAREGARRRRLTELADEIRSVTDALARIDAEAAAVGRREQEARREAAAAPTDEAVRVALAEVGTAARAMAGLRTRVVEAESRVAARRRVLEAAIKTRDDAAADLGIAAWVEDLRGLEQAIAAYRETLAALWPAIRSHGAARAQASRAAEAADEAARIEAENATLLLEARKKARAAAAERDTLQQSVGAAVEEILRRLAEVRGTLVLTQAELEQARKAREDMRVREAVAREKVETERRTLDAAGASRDEAIVALRTFAEAKLLDVAQAGVDAGEPASWSVTRAVDLARDLDAALADIDSEDSAWQRVQKDVHASVQRLTDALLPHGYQPGMTVEDGLFVVTVPFRGRECSMSELRDALGDEVVTRQTLLDAREREILENHLIGEVSAHLHDRLRAAETLVREMNEELRTRRTSTGMTLRFTWDPQDEAPPGLLEARTRLLRMGATWSPAERQALGAFLQERIRSVRNANDTGTWQEHLAVALDYRAWHQFSVERQQDGAWKRLTRRTHGTGSGGEKAIALTIPQFAAAAAHYRTADPLAPRLILLDEAFVGIDKTMRAQCMGLLHAFDLDFVMTSEQEWGCYATLPGVAIYQLSTRPGIDAVGVARWVWNGREIARDASPLPSAAPPPSEATPAFPSADNSGRFPALTDGDGAPS